MSPYDASLADRVRSEQVQLIYRQAPPAIAISVLVAGLVAYVLWEVTNRTPRP